jgi:hypothetical protein
MLEPKCGYRAIDACIFEVIKKPRCFYEYARWLNAMPSLTDSGSVIFSAHQLQREALTHMRAFLLPSLPISNFLSELEHMPWTSTRPTEEGHYWMKDSEERHELVKVERGMDGSLQVLSFGFDDSDDLDGALCADMQWFGPLIPPN